MTRLLRLICVASALLPAAASAQSRVAVHVRVVPEGKAVHPSDKATVVWLEPIGPTASFIPHSHYVLLQKNRMFHPHVQVIPVGAVVDFPNADPFFHNVFSLFDGRRFDLGLYEAGSSKSITFPREGISYIFCNIHPEMSAVVLALSTPYYSLSHVNSTAEISAVPQGAYTLHVWVEGVPQSALVPLEKRVEISPSKSDLGMVVIPVPAKSETHTNKFGQPYTPESHSPY